MLKLELFSSGTDACFPILNSSLSSDTCEEVVQLREAVFAARARLKQAELEAEQWKEELRRLQAHTQEQGQQIHILRQERQASQEKTNRLVCVCADPFVVCVSTHLNADRDVSSGSSMMCLYCNSSYVRAESSFTPCRVNCKCTTECVPAQRPTKVRPVHWATAVLVFSHLSICIALCFHHHVCNAPGNKWFWF